MDVSPINTLQIVKFVSGSYSAYKQNRRVDDANPRQLLCGEVLRGEYPFSWGRVIERNVGTFIVWDIHINSFAATANDETNHCARKTNILTAIRNAYPDYSNEDSILAVALHDSWCIYPGSKGAALTIASPSMCRRKARDWVAEYILALFIPEYITKKLS